MEQKSFHRKLSAILSADVSGYSHLMQDDEAATVTTLKSYKQAFFDLIKRHRGRVVDSPGDNLLAEFASVVDAVQCAVAVQKELQARNAELPENRRMQFRIGVNLGDVIEEGERIYGDGVNIAARLESIANPGGICISKTAFDQIETKLPFGYEFLGEQTVKNISKPVGAYRVVLEPRVTKRRGARLKAHGTRRQLSFYGLLGLVIVAAAAALWHFAHRPALPPVEKADPKKMAFPLPDKPSIAVMPFVNMSDDPKQDFFSDGITEEIITALSKLSQLFVIARNSTSTYRGKPTSAKQISEALGVRYVLEGSVRRDGDRVRIGTQLIDALTGHQMWAERYDRDLKDIFSLQDEITMKIVTELRVKLTAGESARLAAKGTKNLDAYLKALEAADQLGRWTKTSNLAAKRLAEEAIALDPEYHLGYLLLSVTHDADVFFGTTESPQRSIKTGIDLAKKAISLDESNGVAYGQLGLLYIRLKEYDKAVEQAEKGAPLGPNNFETNRMAAQVLARAGKVQDALPLLDNAIRLNPIPRYTFLIAAGSIYHQAKHYEQALEIYKKAAQLEPNNTGGYVGIAATSSMMGKMEEAREAIGELHRVDHNYTLDNVRRTLMLRGDKDQAAAFRFIEGLRNAGIPEHPAVPLPDKPSIAVLPFVNLSDDSKQELLCDGITDNIINGLSKVPRLLVIARNSTFTYKGKPVKVKQVSEELGVRYVLEGSFQRSGDRVRITAQLVDALTGSALLTERYDGETADLFDLQDDITLKVLNAVRVKLEGGAVSRSIKYFKGKQGLDCYLKHLEANSYVQRMTIPDTNIARQIAEEGIVMCPESPTFYRILAALYQNDYLLGSSKSPDESVEKATELLKKALAMDDGYAEAHAQLSYVYTLRREHDKAIAEGELAVNLAPGSAWTLYWYATALKYAGRPEESIPLFEKAIRLNPLGPGAFYQGLAVALRDTGRLDEAAAFYVKALERAPENFRTHAMLAGVYSMMGRDKEARAEATEVLRINPKFSLEWYARTSAYKDRAVTDKIINDMRKAGLPDKPPPAQP